ncbi:heavy-metal-associated domain-containing protein [Oribacterium sp. WCC10]|uniref:heavy-metal-associated domain-containing protein n=1 Tax=Oribacterium sp. WCC10 TaxID=1855343 RepID=UPI0008EC83FD|nr:heavy metal-associated domain-containing protein [Oribacterium sp. WCC10]SFG14102.1 Copper chaperone CopZ [Oribacterium sp. WCC10]
MVSDIPFNKTDMIVIAILAILFLLGVRVVISFFQKPQAQGLPQNLDAVFDAGRRVTVIVDGMMCGMCEIHVKDAVRKALPDAKDVTASHESGKVKFTLGKKTDMPELLDALHAAIDPEGYRITEVTSN